MALDFESLTADELVVMTADELVPLPLGALHFELIVAAAAVFTAGAELSLAFVPGVNVANVFTAGNEQATAYVPGPTASNAFPAGAAAANATQG